MINLNYFQTLHILHCFRGTLTPERMQEYAESAHYNVEVNGNKHFNRDYYRDSERSMGRGGDFERGVPAYIGDRSMDVSLLTSL